MKMISRKGVSDSVIMEQILDAQTLYACFPADNQKIARKGSWVIVREVPHTVLPFDVPLYSIWRARRVTRYREFRVGHNQFVKWPMMLAEIATPGGDLVLYPTEYVTTEISKWLDLLSEGVSMNFLGEGDPGAMGDAIFYLRAHGLTRVAATTLILPHLAESRFVYFTLDWESD